MRAIVLGHRGRRPARGRGWRSGGSRAIVEFVIEAKPEDMVLIELAGPVDLSGAIEEKLIDLAEILIKIFRPGKPMIAQGIFDPGAKHIFRAGGAGCARRENMAWRDGIENDRARIAIAAKGDASGSIDKDAIERIPKTPAQRTGVRGASPRKTVGAGAVGRIDRRSSECAATAIAEIVEVSLDARHKGADLIVVARLNSAGDPRILAAAIWDKVKAGRRKANRFIAGIGGGPAQPKFTPI